jgi:co-chaperonin GroES (HSP10)
MAREETPLDPDIRPVYSKLLILPDDVPERTAGGIYVPVWARDQRQSACVTGTIIDMGDEAFSFMSDDASFRPGIGDRVAFVRYAGMVVKGKDGRIYKMMNDEDVAAVLGFPFDAKDFEF